MLGATCQVCNPESAFPPPGVAGSDQEGTEIKQGNVKNLWSPHHTKPTGQDSDHKRSNNNGHNCFANRVFAEVQVTKRCNIRSPEHLFKKHTVVITPKIFQAENRPKEPKSNKEMSKTCGPHTTPSQQDRTQTTKPLAWPHLKLPGNMKNLNFFSSPSAF